MKISFDSQLKNFKGEIIPGDAGHAGRNLAEMLWQSNLSDLKTASWSLQLSVDKYVLDMSVLDRQVLLDWLKDINKNPKSNIQIAGGMILQLVQIIEKQTESK